MEFTNSMKIFYFFPIFMIFISGCTSKVDQILDDQTKQERALKEIQAAKDRESKVDILENSATSTQAVCISTNQLKLIVTENAAHPIKCQDQTKLSDQYKVGPICPGGINIAAITPSAAFVSCSDMPICGVRPSKTIPLSTADSSLKMTQLIYEKLPWGCTGKINVKGDTTIEVPFDIKPPPCEYCAAKAISTCEACGDDKIPPKFNDVVVDKTTKCHTFNILVFAEDLESGLNREPYSYDGGKTWTDSNHYTVTGATLNMATETIWIRDRAGNITKYAKALSDTAMLCSCNTPWGETLAHGDSRSVYQVTQVECDQSCSGQIQSRTCTDGKLSGSDNYKYSSCVTKDCPSCTTPWGDMVKHRDSVVAYKQTDVSCKDQCESKTSTCDKGNWSVDLIGYVQKECKFTYPKCDCDQKGRVVKTGTSLDVYTKESYECSEAPVKGQVSCLMGALTGNTDYGYVSYTVKPCKCLTAWGQMLDKDQIVAAYKAKIATCTDTFSCDDATNRIKIKCVDNINNTLEMTEGLGPIGSYKEPTCAFKPCKCKHLNVEFGPADPPLAVYKLNTASYPSRCDMNGNKGSVKCTSDILLTGDTSTSTFPYTECTDASGAGTGSGDSDYDKGLGVGGGSGGGAGNDKGDGEGFRRRAKGGKGAGCNPDIAPYYCPGSILFLNVGTSGQFCLLPGSDGYSILNTESTNFKQRIAPGGWVSAYSVKQVKKPDSCANYMGIIRCTDGKMSDSDKYKYMQCTETD